MTIECEMCEENKPNEEVYHIDIYQPFDSEPSFSGNICECCYDSNDFSMCDLCFREIFNTNGMRINTRYNPKTEGLECVSCLHEHWFENGMERFDEGDWFNDSDLTINGFNKYVSMFLRSQDSIDYAKKVFKTLQHKNKLIVSIERSGMGLEYHIALWIKEKNKKVVK